MNALLLIVAVAWLGFFGCLAAWLWARPRKKQGADPFLAATSGPVTDVHGGDAHGDALDDTLRQLDEDARDRRRDDLRQNVLRHAPRTLAVCALFLVALLVAYQLGLFTGGREKRRVSDAAFGFGTSRSGFSWGNKKFYARAGQSVQVSYAIESGTGRLYLSVDHALNLLNPRPFDAPPLWSQTVQAPGTWSTAVPIPENGWYRITISGWPARGGSLSYDVSWKVR